MNQELRLFRETVRRVARDELAPRQGHWRAQGRPDAEDWLRAGARGLLLPEIGESYGGGGGSFAHEAVVLEELATAGVYLGSIVQSVVARYVNAYGLEAQKCSWLPRMARGELVGAIAMTEPGAGSDLQGIRCTARRAGDQYVINGSKTFVTNGWHAGLVCLAVKTDPEATGVRSLSLIMVETRDLSGYRVGRLLEKVGRQEQDTCELFFEDVRVPAENLLGGVEGRGLAQMMEQLPYERLSMGVGAVATAERAVALTAAYLKQRPAYGKTLFDLQDARFKLAECATETRVARIFLDDCVTRLTEQRLDPVAAAMAKYWLTESEWRVLDTCVQLHGGYGYMWEYDIARMWAAARVERIFSGANEVMKEMIAWSL
jgi:acyl-CoA dehydrogenase